LPKTAAALSKVPNKTSGVNAVYTKSRDIEAGSERETNHGTDQAEKIEITMTVDGRTHFRKNRNVSTLDVLDEKMKRVKINWGWRS